VRVRTEVTAEKLRGGFYSPDSLVRICLDRVNELLGDRQDVSVLEPAAGDGSFLRGIAHHDLLRRGVRVTAVELIGEEADKSRHALAGVGLDGEVFEASFLEWVIGRGNFDAAVGNPPFVRYQFVSSDDQAALPVLSEQLGISFAGVSNLWIPIVLGSLGALGAGGAFAFIVPSECFTGVSARTVRRWLAAHTAHLRVDLFPVGSFPNVLQEVVVLSGTRSTTPSGTLEVREHVAHGAVLSWVHELGDDPTWTRHLLEPEHTQALEEALRIPVVKRLGLVARFEVAAVTGANDYFCVDQDTVDSYGLRDWSLPLLPRIRHATGLIYRADDQARTAAGGAKAYLLDFSSERPDPTAMIGPGVYLGLGTAAAINERYKTRIREPWYRVPHIKAGDLMLSKRSHRFPRVVKNEAGVVTTDTIYRGAMRPDYLHREADLTAAFHNSLTLLTAEVEGRSFGGGVLELVPSEIARLSVPMAEGFGSHLGMLDAKARSLALSDDGEELVVLTDQLLERAKVGFTRELLATLRAARLALLRRRLERSAAAD
jgi:adenine-specific DNA methylase